MKKFILGLFLILGAMSIAAPEYVDFSDKDNAEYLTNTFKRSAPSALKFLDETENNRAYIQRFKGELYIYNIIAKEQKVNGCYITITFSEIDDLTEEKLNEKIDILLDEVESFLK